MKSGTHYDCSVLIAYAFETVSQLNKEKNCVPLLFKYGICRGIHSLLECTLLGTI